MTGQNLITFSRDSSGTYVDSEGVIQMAGHNLLTYSEEFNNSAWFKVNVPSVTVNDTLDPNGDQTADLISRTTNQTIAYQLSPGAGTYVFSVYAKAGSSNLVTLASSVSFRGAAVTFDLSTGVPGSVVNYYSGSDASIALSNPAMTDAGNGWWRCQVNVAHTGFRAVHVEPGDLTNTAASAYFWGAQLEKSAKVSPYLKTTTSTVAAPRFDHDPTTGESLGLLVEESRTNLVTYSEQFDNVVWTKLGPSTSVTPNAATAPDGTNTAYLLTTVADTAVGQNLLYQLVPNQASTDLTGSIYVKSSGSAAVARFFVNGDGGADRQIINVSLTNEWQRISLPVYNSTATNAFIHVKAGDNDNQIKSLYIWGAQVEAGSFPTSYIPTTGTALTRSADVAEITGTNFSSWYNQSEGTIFTEAQMEFQLSAAGKTPTIYASGTFPDRLWYLYILNSINRLQIGADAHANFVGTFSSSPQTFKVAQALSNSDLTYSASKDGATPITGTLGKSITNTTNLQIGLGVGAVRRIYRLTYFPERLPDATLQAITAS